MSSTVSSQLLEATKATSQNKFSILSNVSAESPPDLDIGSPALIQEIHIDVHVLHNTSPEIRQR